LWAWGKCGYKILQYYGAAVPVIASPVGINMEFVRQGEDGYLASNLEEWEEYLSQMLDDSLLRKRMGEKGYEYLSQNHTQEIFAMKYLGVFRKLVET